MLIEFISTLHVHAPVQRKHIVNEYLNNDSLGLLFVNIKYLVR